MGQSLSLPSVQLPIEGSSQTPILQREGSTSNSGLTEEQFVFSHAGAAALSDSNSEAGPFTGCPNEDCIRFILGNQDASFMDFLKFAANRRFQIDSVNMEFIEAD